MKRMRKFKRPPKNANTAEYTFKINTVKGEHEHSVLCDTLSEAWGNVAGLAAQLNSDRIVLVKKEYVEVTVRYNESL